MMMIVTSLPSLDSASLPDSESEELELELELDVALPKVSESAGALAASRDTVGTGIA